MKTKPCLTLEDARLALAASYAEASANGWAVTIAVVDDAGLTLALERMDGCAPISSLIAVDKARTAALGRRESKVYEDMINAGRTAFLSAPGLSGLLEGGISSVANTMYSTGRSRRGSSAQPSSPDSHKAQITVATKLAAYR
jgi:glc operon protein GlcG